MHWLSLYWKIFLQEKHWHLVLLHHSWRHLVVLNWLLAPDKNTKTLQYAWVLTENSKYQFHVKVISLVFLVLAGRHVLLLMRKYLHTDILRQMNFIFFSLFLIITTLCVTVFCCFVIHFFCTTITSSQHHFCPNHYLLPHPNLALILTATTPLSHDTPAYINFTA